MQRRYPRNGSEEVVAGHRDSDVLTARLQVIATYQIDSMWAGLRYFHELYEQSSALIKPRKKAREPTPRALDSGLKCVAGWGLKTLDSREKIGLAIILLSAAFILFVLWQIFD